jgi:hypothetical protein
MDVIVTPHHSLPLLQARLHAVHLLAIFIIVYAQSRSETRCLGELTFCGFAALGEHLDVFVTLGRKYVFDSILQRPDDGRPPSSLSMPYRPLFSACPSRPKYRDCVRRDSYAD